MMAEANYIPELDDAFEQLARDVEAEASDAAPDGRGVFAASLAYVGGHALRLRADASTFDTSPRRGGTRAAVRSGGRS